MYFLVQTVNYSTKCEQLEREYLIDQLNIKFRTLDRPKIVDFRLLQVHEFSAIILGLLHNKGR